MNRKKIFVVVAVMIAALSSFAQLLHQSVDNLDDKRKLLMVESAIAGYYVDDVNESQLVESAIRAMLEELDPHSSYSTKDETKEMQETMQGSFSGVGIQFRMEKDTLYVVQTIAGGPSEKVGIMPGDRFIMVDDSVIAGKKLKNTSIMKLLRGPKGTKVNIKVKRTGNSDLLDFLIVRDDIPVNSIDAVYMADSKTGYIRMSRFAATTFAEYKEAIAKLQKQGMTQLILDLTDNGGGYMNIAVEIANEMLSRNNLIVYTEGRNSPRRNYNADGIGKFRSQKVVVMLNQFSASASEILAGALQDWDRGVLVGRRSFGKGLVQREFLLPDSSSYRLTIARYFTPSGRNIQKPYKKGDREDYDKDIMDRYNHGEFLSADSIHFDDSLKFTTLRTNRTVYGGGGIMPDVFVPLDTTKYTSYYRRLTAKGLISQFAIHYVDKHRDVLKTKFSDVDMFVNGFVVDSDMIDSLVSSAKDEGVVPEDNDVADSSDLLALVIKALIANDIWGTSAYFQIVNTDNDIYKEALSIINDDVRYQKILDPRVKTSDKISKPKDDRPKRLK